MNIAFSGAHATGKTSLIEALAAQRPSFRVVVEPYLQLEEEGVLFEDTPSLDDFERQLERSVHSLVTSLGDALFDRCPLDFVAYASTHEDADRFDEGAWFPEVHRALQCLDLVVFVPIEKPDRIAARMPEEDALRQQVDEALRDLILADRWSLDIPTFEVRGSLEERVHQVLVALEGVR